MTHRVYQLLGSLCLLGVPALVSADACPTGSGAQAGKRSPEEAAAAKSLFNKGLSLQATKRDEACKMFESSLQLDPQIGALLNVADCREQRGRLLEAHALFAEAAGAATRAGDRRADFASQRVVALEARLVRITVRISDPSPPGDLAIRVGACAVTQPAATSVAMPGAIVVEVTAPGRRPFRVDRVATAGEEIVIDVPALVPYEDREADLKAKQAEAVVATERRKAEQLATERERAQARRYDAHPARTWTLVTGGIGAAALVTGVIFGSRARRAQASFDDAGCGDRSQLLDETEYASCSDVRERGQRDALVGNGLMIGGAAVLAASVAVFVLDPGNVERPARAAVAISPTSVRLSVRW